MEPEKIIAGKYVLIVDDEQDVLDTLVELLDMCRIDTAATFIEAESLLKKNPYDIAVLDIMGVNGHELLKIANSQNIPAIMLTAKAQTNDSLNHLAEEGAAYYAPKERMHELDIFLSDVFQAIDEGKSSWDKMLERVCISITRKSMEQNRGGSYKGA